MRGLWAVYRKELEDHFSSTRSILLLTVILMVGLVTAYTVGSGLRKELEGMAKPSLVFLLLFTSTGAVFSLAQFIAFFGPLIGMVLGFDAINRERSARTLSKLLSQPIYRDAVIITWDNEGPSFIVALDKKTGAERWRMAREEPTSWATPLVVTTDGKAPGQHRRCGLWPLRTPARVRALDSPGCSPLLVAKKADDHEHERLELDVSGQRAAGDSLRRRAGRHHRHAGDRLDV